MFGNGYGNGTGQFDDALNRLNNTKPVKQKERDPFIADGHNGNLLVLAVEPYDGKEKGACVRVVFEVLESQVHPVGSKVCKMFMLQRPSKFPGQTNDADRWVNFVQKTICVTPQTPVHQENMALLKTRVSDQLLRGMVVKARGVANQNKTWTEVYFDSVQQTQAEIAQRRAAADAKWGPWLPYEKRNNLDAAPPAPNYGTMSPQAQGFVQSYQQPAQPQGFVQQGQPWGQPAPPPQAPQMSPQAPQMPPQWAQQPAAAPAPQPASPAGGSLLGQIPPGNGNIPF